MQSPNKMRRMGILAASIGLVLCLSPGAFAQSAADPTGEPPIGIEEKPGARGPALTGVLGLVLVNSNGLAADRAEIVVRLRRGRMLLTFFAPLAGPLFFDTDEEKAQLQADVLEAVRDDVLGGFFADSCGRIGDQCPWVDLVLKKADEFGLTDDGTTNQYVFMDVTVATTEPL